ncbi:MAG: ATP-binding protein [Bacteroidota bacterium]|nr:ATP-binding protein [Bacteroidota bacterium]
MITELVIKNFKSISEQSYKFSDFDLLVGRNNSGKSSILQAMAIWQYCVDEFHRMKRKGKTGAQIVLPNFTALPLPEFNLLWTNKVDRKYPKENGKKKQEYILIEITISYIKSDGSYGEFGISLRYQTPQSIYAIPIKGWKEFNSLDKAGELPRIVYVPPFSGLDPFEKWADDGVVKQNVGKGQPGSVLRNLLFRVIDRYESDKEGKPLRIESEKIKNWKTIQTKIHEWFGVNLLHPEYEKGVSINIESKYENENGKEFDIISGGSGFHQALTLLAFYYGYEGVTTILFDEPDAHMHVNLQREILNYFRELKATQFIIATHAEEFIKGVEPENIYSVLTPKPERVQSNPEIITALSDVDNMAIVRTKQDPHILYVEGEDDERLLNAWASVLKKENVLKRFYIETMGGTTKKEMKDKSDKHYAGLKKIVPNVKRLMLFDFDTEETSFHPQANNPGLFEWNRKNIENYLLVPNAWKRAILDRRNETENNLFNQPMCDMVDEFFVGENLTLPPGATWKDVDANIFKVIDGKRILFEQDNSLFQRLHIKYELQINREVVSRNLILEELHMDVTNFFEKLEATLSA